MTAPAPELGGLARRVVALAAAGVTGRDVGQVIAQAPSAAWEPAEVVAALERQRGVPLAAVEAEEALRELGARVVLPDDAAYPSRLRPLWPHGGAPLWLFAVGPLPDAPAAAVVGTRQPTAAGLEVASWLGRALAQAGITVVSGLARGVDQAAHRGALAAGGATVGVLGAGLDVDYPRGDSALRADVAAAGGLVTELPCGAAPRPRHFLARNRIISGLADVTVVVEGRARSGALATAQRAAEQGREVLAVPGSPLAAASGGPNALLRDGATPVTHPDDVVAAVAAAAANGGSPPPLAPSLGRPHDGPGPDAAAGLDPVATTLLGLLGPTPVGIDALVRATDLPVGEVLAAVARLLTRGLVTHTSEGVAAAPARR